MRLKLDEEHDDDPALSLLNLVDVFLVLVAVLLLSMAQNPLNAMGEKKVTVIKNAGQPNMEIVMKDGNKVERYKAEEAATKGKGVKIGSAYRLQDGSLVYVPD